MRAFLASIIIACCTTTSHAQSVSEQISQSRSFILGQGVEDVNQSGPALLDGIGGRWGWIPLEGKLTEKTVAHGCTVLKNEITDVSESGFVFTQSAGERRRAVQYVNNTGNVYMAKMVNPEEFFTALSIGDNTEALKKRRLEVQAAVNRPNIFIRPSPDILVQISGYLMNMWARCPNS